MKGRKRPAKRKHNRLRARAPGHPRQCKSRNLQWTARPTPAGRERRAQAAWAAARDGPRLIRSTISAPTMQSPPEIIDATV